MKKLICSLFITVATLIACSTISIPKDIDEWIWTYIYPENEGEEGYCYAEPDYYRHFATMQLTRKIGSDWDCKVKGFTFNRKVLTITCQSGHIILDSEYTKTEEDCEKFLKMEK